MKSTTPLRWLWIAILVLFLAGCATTGDDETRVEERDGDGLTAEELEALDRQRERERAAESRGLSDRRSLEGSALDEMLDDPGSAIGKRTIYFAFDSSEIRDQDMQIIESHASFLSRHPDQRMMVQGHTDERGSPSYNLALGERRAATVKRAMVLSGAADEQIKVISYGEEDPAMLGSSEEAWRMNRRVELLYR